MVSTCIHPIPFVALLGAPVNIIVDTIVISVNRGCFWRLRRLFGRRLCRLSRLGGLGGLGRRWRGRCRVNAKGFYVPLDLHNPGGYPTVGAQVQPVAC